MHVRAALWVRAAAARQTARRVSAAAEQTRSKVACCRAAQTSVAAHFGGSLRGLGNAAREDVGAEVESGGGNARESTVRAHATRTRARICTRELVEA